MTKWYSRLMWGMMLSVPLAFAAPLAAQEDGEVDDAEMVEEEAETGESAAQEQQASGEESQSGEQIVATLEDIERLISLPPRTEMGREADEDLQDPRNLFESEATQTALLGDTPDFVYFPEGVDPMIIPWVREQIVVDEKLGDARELVDRARRDRDKDAAQRALEIVQELEENYPEAASRNNIREVRRAAENIMAQDFSSGPVTRQPTVAPEPEVELPPWIKLNTRGVLLDRDNPSESLALVGNFIVKAGEPIERFPAVTVKEILPQQVIYEYQGVDFLVQVTPQ